MSDPLAVLLRPLAQTTQAWRKCKQVRQVAQTNMRTTHIQQHYRSIHTTRTHLVHRRGVSGQASITHLAALVAEPLLTRAQRTEILRRQRHNIGPELHAHNKTTHSPPPHLRRPTHLKYDAPAVRGANLHIEEDPRELGLPSGGRCGVGLCAPRITTSACGCGGGSHQAHPWAQHCTCEHFGAASREGVTPPRCQVDASPAAAA